MDTIVYTHVPLPSSSINCVKTAILDVTKINTSPDLFLKTMLFYLLMLKATVSLDT